MSFRIDDSRSWVLLTGATGLLGSALLQELLSRKHRVLCLVRGSAPAEARKRLAHALSVWGCDADAPLERGQLAVIRGDLLQPGLGLSTAVVDRLGRLVKSVVHVAGSTAFSVQTDPNLVRTNIDGTKNLFALAAVCGCTDWHLFSTAYVCGRCDRASEGLAEVPPEFRNEYEWTKWTAERQTQSAAARAGASLTTYRPSVIVGHSESGAISRFSGIYRVFRAVALLARAAGQQDDINRHNIPLRIPADGNARPNLVFIDDVAREFGDLFSQPRARGRIFHLVNPDPPTNAAVQQALEQYYDIAGGRFVGTRSPIPSSQRTAYEDIFFDVVLDTEPYILEAPIFDRSHTDQFVSRPPTLWNGERLCRLIHFGESSAWRRQKSNGRLSGDFDGDFAAYFQHFMPRAHRRFRLAHVASLDLNIRYVIGRSAAGDWFCRYRDGRLMDVGPTNGIAPDVTYRITPANFWSIVKGQSSAADSFLSGSVQIEGNVERALKFAVVLQQFVREFPYGPAAHEQHAN